MGEGGYKNSICADVLPRREPNEVKLKWYTYAGAQEWVRRNNRFDSYRLKKRAMERDEFAEITQRHAAITKLSSAPPRQGWIK